VSQDWYWRWKPLVEVVLALLVLIISAPVLALAALLIKLTLRGPAIYTQKRVGKDGRLFTIYKLRTMDRDCEEQTGAVWSGPDDPRVTRLGRILRVTHLDEFPQAVNVLLGDMSLIGPRPERPEIVKLLRFKVDGYTRRLCVRPGITGLAQVHLPPDVDLDGVRRKLVCDLYYIEHFNAWLDCRIFACTALFLFAFPLRLSRRLLRVPDPLASRAAVGLRMDGPSAIMPIYPPHETSTLPAPVDGVSPI
jgi:lipopolysaccharide/colanic/teichoic acid biosynthesis glycosyltransferase